jgi:nucleoside 2-deoxyribosyltransferase
MSFRFSYTDTNEVIKRLPASPSLAGYWTAARRDFEFFTAKDAAMAEEADVGFMLWDGESSGTVVNAARLVATGKPVVIYLASEKRFLTLKSRSHLEMLLAPCTPEVRQRIDRYVAQHASSQPMMFL